MPRDIARSVDEFCSALSGRGQQNGLTARRRGPQLSVYRTARVYIVRSWVFMHNDALKRLFASSHL